MPIASTRNFLAALLLALPAGVVPICLGQTSQNPVSSQSTTLTYGQAFTPSYFGGSGNGSWQFCINTLTNFNPGPGEPSGTELPNGTWETAWTPPSVGGYQFYIAHSGNGTYSNALAGWYTLTVNKANQPTVSSQNATITYGQSFTPSYFGGAGTGAWQFTIDLNTNWNPGPGEPAGTELPNGQWETSWTPPAAGTYYFYVANNGDSNYNVSNFSGWYTLTVNAPPSPPSITSPSSASGTFGTYLSYQITATNSPTSYNATGLPTGFSVNTSSGLISGTPTAAGSPVVTVTATNGSGTSPGVPVTFNIGKASQPTVYVSPTSDTISTGQQLTLTASGGAGTGAYTWGGSASGTGTTTSVSFGTANTYTVTVYRAGDSNYQPSSPPAQATITVGPLLPQTVTLSPSGANNTLTVAAGTTVMFSVAGGLGQGTYVWGGSASGSNAMEAVTFSTAGSAQVSVYHTGDSTYQASNNAAVSVTVVSATNDSGSADTQLKYLVPVP